MATSPYFRHNVRSEQELYEDLIVESLKFYGQDMWYIPREVVHRDTIFDDDILSRFEYAYKVEMYIENIEGFDGDGDLFSKFGVEIRDAATFILARRRWQKVIAPLAQNDQNYKGTKYYRPREGDLIHIPLSGSTFEIRKVEDEVPFYQLGQLPVFRMRCELFEFSNEEFDTGIEGIDRVETFAAYQYVLTMDSSSTGFTIGETITQTVSDYNVTGKIVQWSDSDNKMYVANVGNNSGVYRDFSTTNTVVGSESGAVATPTLVEQLQNIQKNSPGNELPSFDVSAFEFVDFSESNPFGDPI